MTLTLVDKCGTRAILVNYVRKSYAAIIVGKNHGSRAPNVLSSLI